MTAPWNGLPPDSSQSGYHWVRAKHDRSLIPMHWRDPCWSGTLCHRAMPDLMATLATYHAPCVPPELAVEQGAA